MDPRGHASVAVELIVRAEELILRADRDVEVKRKDVVAVRVRWPRPWQALPVAPLLSVRMADRPDRWRTLFWGPAVATPRRLRSALAEHGWVE